MNREHPEVAMLRWAQEWLFYAKKEKSRQHQGVSTSLKRGYPLERWALAFYHQHQQEIHAYLK